MLDFLRERLGKDFATRPETWATAAGHVPEEHQRMIGETLRNKLTNYLEQKSIIQCASGAGAGQMMIHYLVKSLSSRTLLAPRRQVNAPDTDKNACLTKALFKLYPNVSSSKERDEPPAPDVAQDYLTPGRLDA